MKFGSLIAIDDLTFQQKKITSHLLLVKWRAGKTTVFNCLTGFYKATKIRFGSYMYLNKDNNKMDLKIF